MRPDREEFAFHKLNADGQKAVQQIAQEFSRLLDELEIITGNSSRYYSLCRTKLEEASFFAKKSVAVRPEFQEK